jgi:hypothetical protein
MAQSGSMTPARAWWWHGTMLLETRHRVRGFEAVVIVARVSTFLEFEKIFFDFFRICRASRLPAEASKPIPGNTRAATRNR